jgi:hypothetical protein
MMLAIRVVECLCAETTVWNLLKDIPRFLQKLRWGSGATREPTATAHYRNGLTSIVERVVFHWMAPHCDDCDLVEEMV